MPESETQQILKTSEIVELLENLSIEKYTLYSNFYIGNPKVIEFDDAQEYYNLVKDLKIKSHKEYITSPCCLDKLQSNYGDWIFETKIHRSDSELQVIINKLEEENLLI